MTPRFDRAFAIVVDHEGGFVNHPRDPGGATNRGVSLRYARTRGLLFDLDRDGDVDEDDIRLVTLDHARAAFHADFWRPVSGDELPPGLALLLFDAAIHSGAPQAAQWLQQAAGVKADGVVGPITRRAAWQPGMAQRFHRRRIEALTRLPGWHAFGRGWATRLAVLPFQAQEMEGA